MITGGGGSSSVTAEYLSSPPSLSDTQTTPLLCDTHGNQLVSIQAIGSAAGQQNMAGSLPVVLASNQSAIPVNLQDGTGSAVDKGQTNMAGSLPVALASNQSAIPINLQDGSGSAVDKGQAAMASSLPVVIASNQSAVPVSGTVTATQTYTTIKNEMDTALMDTSSTNINGSGGAFVQVVSSLGNACTRIKIADTTGSFIGVYTGGSGSEVFAFMIHPGQDNYTEFAIASSTRVSLRNMQSTTISSGLLILQFSS